MADERTAADLRADGSQVAAALKRVRSAANCAGIRRRIAQRGWTAEVGAEGLARFRGLHGEGAETPDWPCTAPGLPVTTWTPELG